jgi:hypothetical protein
MVTQTKKIATRTSTVAAIAALAFGVLGLATPAQADEGFSNQQLLNDCNGSAISGDGGTGSIGFLDGCTFEESSTQTYTIWKGVGETVTNCTSNKGTIDQALSGSESWSSGGSAGGNINFIKDWFMGGLSGEYNWNHTVTETHSSTIHVEPGRKAVLTEGAETVEKQGRIRVNYRSKVGDHYIWYINGVTLTTPTGYVEKGQDNKACGETLLNGR